MIRRIQALNYRCLRYVDVLLDGPFLALVGPNASGKSTLLDVIGFLGDLIRDGLDAAVERRSRNFQDLVWGRPRTSPEFELAVEFDIPPALRGKPPGKDRYRCFRYEVAIRESHDGLRIGSEGGFLGTPPLPMFDDDPFAPSKTFPSTRPIPESILTDTGSSYYHRVLGKSADGMDSFDTETASYGDRLMGGSALNIAFGPRRSTLKNLPESPAHFPVATHAKRILETGVQKLFLDSRRLRLASPPDGRRTGFVPDGSNLPWAVQRLRETDLSKFDEWLDHVRTALREIEDVRVVEREDDRHAYLMLRYSTGVEVPSWTVSDGTLRLLALTLIAYLPDSGNIYLMEEPENGVHPLAVETVYQSLASVYDSQVLVATHSPVLLNCAGPRDVLCFAMNDEGATDIVPGNRHPRLRTWRSGADMDLLFAREILG